MIGRCPICNAAGIEHRAEGLAAATASCSNASCILHQSSQDETNKHVLLSQWPLEGVEYFASQDRSHIAFNRPATASDPTDFALSCAAIIAHELEAGIPPKQSVPSASMSGPSCHPEGFWATSLFAIGVCSVCGRVDPAHQFNSRKNGELKEPSR